MSNKIKPKTLLIFPPSTVYAGDPTVPAITPPLGLAYLASFLEKHGYPVVIMDAIAEGAKKKNKNKPVIVYGLSDKQIIKKIRRIKPDLVGITCMYTAYAGDAHRVAKLVKQYSSKTPVVFGGAHSSIFPELTLKDKNVDIVVVGEGEEVFLELVRRLERGMSLTTVLGTFVRKNGKIVRNRPDKYIKNLDSVPFPAWHLLPMKKYLDAPDYQYAMRKPGMVVVSSRGCPGRCVYCSIHSVWGHTWRGRSPKNVVDEIETLYQDYGVREFYFLDDSMGVSKPRLRGICEEIIKRKLDIRWTTPNGIAHWSLDEGLLDLMKKSGCYRITFGIESGNLQMRRFIGKPYPLSQARRMIRHANKIGMWTLCTNIIGFPDETKKQIQDTINFAIKSDTDLAIFYLLCPHPGTAIYEVFRQNGLINLDYIFTPTKKLKASEFTQIGRALAGRGVRTNHFTQQELQTIISQAYKKFFRQRVLSFLNPRRVFNKIHSFEDLRYVTRIGINSLKIIVRDMFYKRFSSQMLRRSID